MEKQENQAAGQPGDGLYRPAPSASQERDSVLIPQSEMLQFYFTLLVNFHPCKSRDVVIE